MPQEHLLTHPLSCYYQKLETFKNFRHLKRSLLYQSIRSHIDDLMRDREYGFYAPNQPYEKKPFYRAVAWNIERGLQFEGILDVCKNHPQISKADIFLLTETDIGMARTQNLNVAYELARELQMNYFFSPAYLNFNQGNSIESHAAGENTSALHGNALLSRYPLENLRTVWLKNCKDKMKGKEKRVGCQKALVADAVLPFRKITVIVAHLDAHSSQRQRAQQMKTILKGVQKERHPILLGGDLNTSTYNARHGFFAFCGFWNKVFRGVGKAIREHYPYPDRYYDRHLFKIFRQYGFDYQSFNEKGVGTIHYKVDDLRGNYLMQEVVPEWCRRIAEETLRKSGGEVSIKMDWFGAKWLKLASPDIPGVMPPKVFSNLTHEGKAISDHDPILVDIDVYG